MPFRKEKTVYVKQVFLRYTSVSGEVADAIVAMGDFVTFEKKELVKDYNEDETHIRIVLKGCGGYFINKSGNDFCFYFSFKDDIFFDYPSLFSPGENEYKIKLATIDKTEAFILPVKKLLDFAGATFYGELLRRTCAEYLYFDVQELYFDRIFLSAHERYLKLIKRTPDIAQKIDHKYIASYLGITAESLSRLRKKHLKTI